MEKIYTQRIGVRLTEQERKEISKMLRAANKGRKEKLSLSRFIITTLIRYGYEGI